MWVFLSTRHAAHTLDGRTDCWIWKKNVSGFYIFARTVGADLFVQKRKEPTFWIDFYRVRSDSPLPSLKGGKKTSFFILCCVAQQFERGTKWHTAGLRHNNLKLFFSFFVSPPLNFWKVKETTQENEKKIKKRISSCFYGPDVSGLSIPCTSAWAMAFFFFFFYGTVNSARGAPRILFKKKGD